MPAALSLTSIKDVTDVGRRAPTSTLVRAVATAIFVVAFALVAILLLAVQPAWWRGFFAATVVSICAAAASIPVVGWGMKFGLRRPEILTGAYFAAMFVRAIICLGGASAAILLGGYPRAATLLMVAPYYVAILAAETFVVARVLLNTGPNSSEKSPAVVVEPKHA